LSGRSGLSVSRIFAPGEVVSWNGVEWERRTTANALLPAARVHVPHLDEQVVDETRGMLHRSALLGAPTTPTASWSS